MNENLKKKNYGNTKIQFYTPINKYIGIQNSFIYKKDLIVHLYIDTETSIHLYIDTFNCTPMHYSSY